MSINEETFERLVNELRGILIDGTEVSRDESGYSASADAMWRAALAAFNYTASEVGATGFQASWAALWFYGEAMHITCPYMVIRAEDALYPQYDLPGRLAAWLDDQRDWLREQATQKLAEPNALRSHRVVEHWQKLAAS